MSRQQLGAIVSSSQAPARVINWRSPDGKPRVVTVTWVPINEQQGNAPQLVNTLNPFRGNLTWGVGEAVAAAVIDYPVRGGTFTITAASVTLDVYANGVASWGAGTTDDPTTKLGAFMSEGASRPGSTPPTLTEELESTASSTIVAVPQAARAYWIEDNVQWRTIGADQAAWEIQCQNRGTPFPQPGVLTRIERWDVQYVRQLVEHDRTPPSVGLPLAIPPRTTHLQVSRVAGYPAPPSRLAVVFVLDLGA